MYTGVFRRRIALLPGLMLIAVAALAGCSNGGSSSAASGAAPEAAAQAASAPAAAGVVPSASGAPAGTGQAASATRLVPTGQQLIYTAQLSVRARDVGAAVSRATLIVSQAGGYVSSENASTDQNHPAKSSATVELKIPAAAYAATLVKLSSGLGTQLSLHQQAQDVTQQVADVTSRVASDEAAIAQLRALLTHAGTVADLLSVQNQINTQESDLEAMQAQQNALNHETAFATVTVTILGPKAVPPPAKSKPAPGLGNGLTGGWHAFRVTLSWLLAIIGAILPFAAVIALLGAAGYWVRRWLARRRAPAAGS
jgi:Domain of unknown function (DUF4349)